VYTDFNQPSIDENFPLAKLKEPHQTEEITDETYGPFKADCEKVVKSYFPDHALIVRPGLIVGPYDSSDRLTYWVRRLADGGKVLVPNTPNEKLQLIDARDLAKWIVKMVETQVVGTYNATGPKEDLIWGQFINECHRLARKPVDLVWADEQFLVDRRCNNWNKLPLWLPSQSKMTGLFHIDCRKAQDKGLSFRPLSETIADTLSWDDQRADRIMRVGLELEEEATLLNQISNE
jgi:2'-hydroxyisoflavone reductase